MKRFYKILLVLTLVFTVGFGLIACGDDKDPVEYTVTFNVDGGTPAVPTQTIESGKTAVRPSQDPTKEGYTFVNWYKVSETQPFVFTTPITANIVLIAKWDEDELPVDPDIALVAAAKEKLLIAYSEGDNAQAVKQNVTLTTLVDAVVVTWKSDKADVISASGVVTRPAADTEVKLTATLVKGVVTDEKEFILTVLEREPSVALPALVEHYKETLGNPEWKATENVTLLAEIEGVAITWVVQAGGDFFTEAGVVTRPTFAQGEQSVTLRANLADGTSKTFYFVIDKLEQTDSEKIQAELNRIVLAPSTSSGYLEQNFSIVSEVTIDGTKVKVVWTSSDPETLSNAGEIIPFAGDDRDVVFTATITYNDIELSKSITLKIKSVKEFDSFKTALSTENFVVEGKTVVGEKVLVKGVYVYDVITDGYYLASADNMLAFVFGNVPDGIAKNKLYDIITTIDVYYGTYQLKAVSFSNEREGTLHTITPLKVTLEEITSLPIPTNTAPNHHTLYKLVDVKVRVDDPAGDYKTFFVAQDLASGTTLTDKNSIMVYYKSSLDAIKALNGKNIAWIHVINNGYRSNNVVWNVNYIDKPANIEVDLTDQERVDVVKSSLETKIAKEYYKAADLGFLETVDGVSIVWTSTDAEVIALDGKITIPATPTTVTVTATLTLNDATATITKEVLVGELEVKTVKEALEGSKGDYFKLTGLVTANSANGTFTFEDATGAIAIYASQGKFETGYVYTVTGSRDTRQGLNQLRLLEDPIKGEVGKGVPVELTEEVLADAKALIAHQNKLVSFELALVENFVTDSSYGNVTITLKVGQTTITLYWDSRVTLSAAAKAHIEGIKKNSYVNIIRAPLTWASDSARLGYDHESQIEVVTLTDAQKVALDKNALKLEKKYTSEYTLPTAGFNDSVITWEAAPAASLVQGKLVIPAAGEDPVTVVLTATLTVDTEVETKKFTVVLEAYVPVVALLTHNFDFSSVDRNTSYPNVSTDISLKNLVSDANYSFTILNAAVNNSANITAVEGRGIVLGIRKGKETAPNNFTSAILTTKAAIVNLQKVEITIQNWTTDAEKNFTLATAVNLEVSTDGVDWTVVKDLKPTWNTANNAINSFSEEITNTNGEALYFRIRVVAAENINSTYQLRLIVQTLKFYS